MAFWTSVAQYPSLRGRRAVITGGATGIGSSLVEAFYAQGAHVLFLDIDQTAADALTARLAAQFPPSSRAAMNGKLSFVRVDVTETADLQAAIQGFGENGGIDILINNAANDARHSFTTVKPADWQRTLAVNLDHHLFATQAAVPFFPSKNGGVVVCMGSISWLNKTTGMIGYTTAKAAIHGLVRGLARELGPQNVRVNAVLPGWTMTEKQQNLWIDAQAKKDIAREQCLPDLLRPEDVARTVLFLCSDEARMITQQSLVVDGGWI